MTKLDTFIPRGHTNHTMRRHSSDCDACTNHLKNYGDFVPVHAKNKGESVYDIFVNNVRVLGRVEMTREQMKAKKLELKKRHDDYVQVYCLS